MSLAAPLIVSFWMRAAFTFVDTAYASTIGDEAVAAIGLAVPFEFVMIALWVGMSTGLTSNLSRAMGAGQSERIEQYKTAAGLLILLVMPVFFLLGAGIWLLAERVGLEPGVASAFKIYGSVLISGSALTAFWSVLPDSIVKAHQDTKSTMWAGIASNVINVVLNTIFLFVLEWGVFGIALSTVLGRIGGLVYALRVAKRHEDARRARDEARTDRDRSSDPKPVRALLALAIPSGLTFSLMAIESGLINGLLARLPNATEAIAAYSIYYRVTSFSLNPIIAVGIALLPYAANRYGDRDAPGLRRGIREAGQFSVLYTLLFVTPAMLLLGGTLARALAESPLTTEYAATAMLIVPGACLLSIAFLLCRPVFEGMNNGKPGLVVALIRYLLLTAPGAWLGIRIAEGLGQPALYGLMAGLLVVSGLSSLIFGAWLAIALRRIDQEFGADSPETPGESAKETNRETTKEIAWAAGETPGSSAAKASDSPDAS